MLRMVLGLALAVTLGLPCGAEETSSRSETLIRLSVSSAPAPRPALRYLLLPELKEMSSGNPIFGYYKCFGGQQKYVFDQDAFERREALLTMPLKELPAKEFHDLSPRALSQADEAARLDRPDWQILPQLKSDGVNLLLPDVQQLRSLGTALSGRFRGEVASGRVDDAIRSAKTMFALSRHLGEHPTLIGNLVGFAIANLTIGPLEELLEQPGCPNLYWALTNLPDPLISVDRGAEGERVFVLAEFHDLDELAPMSAEQVTKAIVHFDKLLDQASPMKPPGGVRGWLKAQTGNPETVKAARLRLLDFGYPEERLRRFPVEQVILLDAKREFEDRRDEVMRLFKLPTCQFEAMAARIKKREYSLFSELLLPHTQLVRRSQARLEQRIALLRHVEALRLHSAEHEGALPSRLSEVSVPLPDDPFTGKPFQYELSGGIAHLRGSPPPGMENDATYNIHYAVTIVK